jgi:carbohydrate kinase (thermoresistant glucokinase family)
MMNILVMGVSGCGKTTIGRRLAEALGLPFIEGDKYHGEHNRNKMASGQALTDADRLPWLSKLALLLVEKEGTGGSVLACSALKESYRDILRSGISGSLQVVWLDGSREILLSRVSNRPGHFFPPELLDSQLDTLEPPSPAIRLDIELSIDELVERARLEIVGKRPD